MCGFGSSLPCPTGGLLAVRRWQVKESMGGKARFSARESVEQKPTTSGHVDATGEHTGFLGDPGRGLAHLEEP